MRSFIRNPSGRWPRVETQLRCKNLPRGSVRHGIVAQLSLRPLFWVANICGASRNAALRCCRSAGCAGGRHCHATKSGVVIALRSPINLGAWRSARWPEVVFAESLCTTSDLVRSPETAPPFCPLRPRARRRRIDGLIPIC